MSQVVDEVLAANKKYASSFGAKKDLALPPARGFAILTCMDARLDPAKYAGLSEGDAHVIRNAGGHGPTMPFALSSSRTNCWEPASGLSSTTPTAVWSYSQTT